MPTPSSAPRPKRAVADSSDPYAGSLFANPPAVSNPAPSGKQSPRRHAASPFGNEQDQEGGNDTPFEVRGFATDPKHSGYQILTNYESTYWRAYVGVQAWSLYEVLRSFCHNGNNVCYPSINYLLEVLGIKQRRVLTGWNTEVKGKNYEYPGLIEILQGGGLVIAEVVGDGPLQRYRFHVNLTPDLLRPEQVAELPALLQNKHTEMLQAHFAEMAELSNRRRPAKNSPNMPKVPSTEGQPPFSLQNNNESTENIVENGGMTNCQTGVTICHTPSDNLSHKQHQSNNTQLTRSSTTHLINNNSGDEQQELQPEHLVEALTNHLTDSSTDNSTDVVVALTELGLAENVVQRLTKRFSRERILQKIDYLAYLEECQPNKVKNPRGWLRRAVEENYGAPDGYLSLQERKAQRFAPSEVRGPSYSSYIDQEAQAASQEARASVATQREIERAARRELIRSRHAPDAATVAFWELVQTDVHLTMPSDYYRLIADASVLWMDEQQVAVAIWEREIYRELLHPNRIKALARTIGVLAKRKLDLICEYWDENGQVVPPGTPPPTSD